MDNCAIDKLDPLAPSGQPSAAPGTIAHRHWARWSRPLIVSELRRLHVGGQDMRSDAVARVYRTLPHAVRVHFGSYATGLQAAGIDPAAFVKPTIQWTRESVIRELQRLRDAGENLRPTPIMRGYHKLYDAVRHHFGSWWAGLASIGVRRELLPPWRNVRWSAERVVAELRRRQAAGEPVGSGAIQKTDSSLANAIRRYHRSHEAALRAAGIDPESVRLLRPWTPQLVLDRLCELHRDGRDLCHTSLAKTEWPLIGAMVRRFGSEAKALEAAGIDPAQDRRARRPWAADELLMELGRIASSLGTQAISFGDIKAHDPNISHAARRIFGSVRAAVEAAGLTYRRKRRLGNRQLAHWTDERVLHDIRELHAGGSDLRYRQVRLKYQPLFFAAKQLFGSYVNAVQQAGIDYWSMSQHHLAASRGTANRDETAREHAAPGTAEDVAAAARLTTEIDQ